MTEEQAGYLGLIRAALKAQTAYLQSLETSDMFTSGSANNESNEEGKNSKSKKKSKTHPAQNPQSAALKGTLEGLKGLHGKLHGDLAFGKREFAWGKLTAKDMDEIFALYRSILIPLIGMSSLPDFPTSLVQVWCSDCICTSRYYTNHTIRYEYYHRYI